MAKLAGKKVIKKDEMSQEINLKRYLGRKPTENEKTLFAELAIERINNRTLDGKTIHGGKFKKYSKTYADIKGVTRDSVDLFLKGDMLDAVQEDDASNSNSVKIEVDGGRANINTKKGFNHQTGDTLPKRQWFGVTTDEARAIALSVKEDDPITLKQLSTIAEKKTSTFTLAELQAELEVLDIELE